MLKKLCAPIPNLRNKFWAMMVTEEASKHPSSPGRTKGMAVHGAIPLSPLIDILKRMKNARILLNVAVYNF